MKKLRRYAILATISLILLYTIVQLTMPGIDFNPIQQLRFQRQLTKISDNLNFAGEKVHFKSPQAYNNYYKELRINTENNSSTRLLMYYVSLYMPRIEAALKSQGLPEDIKYVAVAESNLTLNTSQRGASGFWQMRDFTAREYGLEVNEEVDQRYDLEKSTIAASRYFKQAYGTFHSWTMAAASYNRGINGLQRDINRQDDGNSYYDLDLNDETSKYIYKILSMKELVSNPKKYGLKRYRVSHPRMKTIKVTESIPDLKAYLVRYSVTLDELKFYNPWVMANSLTIKKPGVNYILMIPVKNGRSPVLPDTAK